MTGYLPGYMLFYTGRKEIYPMPVTGIPKRVLFYLSKPLRKNGKIWFGDVEKEAFVWIGLILTLHVGKRQIDQID